MEKIIMEKRLINVEVNPLQLAVLMDVLNDCLPQIRNIYEGESDVKFVMKFSDIEKSVVEIYTHCYSAMDIFDYAKQIFQETGSFPDILTLLEMNARKTIHLPGPGEMKSLEFEIIPARIMLVYLLLRGYFDQFQNIMMKSFSELMYLDFGAMQESADAIYEASIAGTGVKEMAAPMVEVYKMTGQLPDGNEN